MSMFNLFKRKGKHKMPTKEEILNLPAEEKQELLKILEEDIKLSADDTKTDEATNEKKDEAQTKVVENTENELVGGKADGTNLEDIAKKHNVTVDVIESELEKGIKVEMEHTNDAEKAKEIALDHLSEQSDYYEKLKQVEQKAPQVNLEEKIADFEKRFNERIETLVDGLSKKLDEKDTVIQNLNKQIEELKRTSPTQMANPKLTQQSFETERETEQKKAVNSWTNSPSTQYAKIK